MTCEQIALAVSALAAVIIGAIYSLNGVMIHRRRLHFRNIGRRLAWWASWLSFLGGIAIAAFFCRHP